MRTVRPKELRRRCHRKHHLHAHIPPLGDQQLVPEVEAVPTSPPGLFLLRMEFCPHGLTSFGFQSLVTAGVAVGLSTAALAGRGM